MKLRYLMLLWLSNNKEYEVCRSPVVLQTSLQNESE